MQRSSKIERREVNGGRTALAAEEERGGGGKGGPFGETGGKCERVKRQKGRREGEKIKRRGRLGRVNSVLKTKEGGRKREKDIALEGRDGPCNLGRSVKERLSEQFSGK